LDDSSLPLGFPDDNNVIIGGRKKWDLRNAKKEKAYDLIFAWRNINPNEQ